MATLVLIFVSVLGGGVYTNTQSQISSLSSNVINETTGNFSSRLLPAIYNTTANIYPNTETLTIWNTTAQYGTLTLNTNYTVLSYSTGQFNIISLGMKNNSYIYLNISYTLGNPDIKNNITAAIGSSFTSLNTVGGYLPIVVLAVIIFLVLGLVMSLTPGFGRESSGGYAL